MRYFITATDTDAGKTFITAALAQHFAARGLSVVAMKPVASGSGTDGVNGDVAALLPLACPAVPVSAINLYSFAPPIAPHIAAAQAGVSIDFARIAAAYQQLCQTHQVVLVEGVGGLLVPLGAGDVADLALHLRLPLILIVNLKLGCINHARLSCEVARARGLSITGWIGNHACNEAMAASDDVIASLKHYLLPVPCLGIVPFCPCPAEAAAFISGI